MSSIVNMSKIRPNFRIELCSVVLLKVILKMEGVWNKKVFLKQLGLGVLTIINTEKEDNLTTRS